MLSTFGSAPCASGLAASAIAAAAARRRANERPVAASRCEEAGAVCHRVGSWLCVGGVGANRTCARGRESRIAVWFRARSGACRGLFSCSTPPTFLLALRLASSPSASSTSGACARSTARPAGRARTAIEVELLAAGLLQRERGPLGHETIRLTDAGIAVLAESLAKNRARRDAHELLVERVAREMTRAGRLAWRGLAVRAKVDSGWAIAMPDVFSIRHTTVEAYAEPIVHEVKVQRADLLADLRRACKRQAYLELGGECWYVIKEGIARADEIPAECGVLVASERGLEVARPAPKRPTRMRLRALDGAGAGDAGRRLAPRRRADAARRRRRRRGADDAASPA